MTLEEMQEIARRIERALKKEGFEDVAYLETEHQPGEPLPIMFELDGEAFVLDLTVG